MRRSWISTTAAFLLGPILLGCSHWVVSDAPLETLVHQGNAIRIGRSGSQVIYLEPVRVSPDTLFGEQARVEFVGAGDMAHAESPTRHVSSFVIARESVRRVEVPAANWGWVPSDRTLDELAAVGKPVRLVVSDSLMVQMKSVRASADSLYGTDVDVERVAGPVSSRNRVGVTRGFDWIAVPRVEIQQVEVLRQDSMVPLVLGLSVLAILAVLAANSSNSMTGPFGKSP